MTIDINEARKLADELPDKYVDRARLLDAARTIRALCDRESEARKLIQALSWRKHPTLDGVWQCPACGCTRTKKEIEYADLDMLHTKFHHKDCKLAAWLGGGKA